MASQPWVVGMKDMNRVEKRKTWKTHLLKEKRVDRWIGRVPV